MPLRQANKPYRGLPMEGGIARRYAEIRRTENQQELFRRQAAELTAGLADGASILEVAPGPGFLAIEMARPGRARVTGLDVSTTFVELATAAARQAGVDVDFRAGDVADMPFDTATFDLVVCQAAFKNFSRPAGALEEIHRVLRSGGTAIIEDMNHDATASGIAGEVQDMGLRRGSAAMTKVILSRLRRRAYSPSQFRQLLAESPFQTCEIAAQGIGLVIRMTKQPPAAG